MPIQPLNKVPIIANNPTLSNIGSLLTAAIVRVDNVNNVGSPIIEDKSLFLLNPESWTETKNAHWVQNIIPGQSDPVLQWISSGPRVVTFDALVTKDISTVVTKSNGSSKSKTNTIFASLAGTLANTAPTITIDSSKYSNDILNISSYLNYYRSLLYPVYSKNNGSLAASPPLVMLFVGKTFFDFPEVNINDDPNAEVNHVSTISSNSVVWAVTNLRINVTKQLPNLDPLEALVNFELTQYTIAPFSRDNFPY